MKQKWTMFACAAMAAVMGSALFAVSYTHLVVRNPYSVRPYQHVLEPLSAYLTIAAEQFVDGKKAGYYNVGPNEDDCCRTGALVEIFIRAWGEGIGWIDRHDGGPHEMCIRDSS